MKFKFKYLGIAFLTFIIMLIFFFYDVEAEEYIEYTTIKFVCNANKTKARETISKFNVSVFDGLDVLVFSGREPKFNYESYRDENGNKVESYLENFGKVEIFQRFTRLTIFYVNSYSVEQLRQALYYELINYYHLSNYTGGIKGYNCHFQENGTIIYTEC